MNKYISLEYLDIRNIKYDGTELEKQTDIFNGCDSLSEVYLNSSMQQIFEGNYEGNIPKGIVYHE